MIASPTTTVLVTGFEPFAGLAANPSWEAARAAQCLDGPRGAIVARCLPVDFDEAPAALRRAVQEVRPDVVVSLGVAVGRSRMSVERVALNCADAAIPDNAGRQPVDEPIDPEGPPAIFSTLPLRGILAAWAEADVPGRISDSAGTYVCNRVMYEGLALAAEHGVRASGFIHVPATPGLARDPQTAVLAQERIDAAVRAAVRVAQAHPGAAA